MWPSKQEQPDALSRALFPLTARTALAFELNQALFRNPIASSATMGNNVAAMEQVYQEPEKVHEEQVGEEQVEKEETPVEEGGEEDQTLAVREETEDASEEVEEKPKITVDDIKTAPMDFRFPTTNQAKHCYTRYNEFHKCASEKGDEAKECQKYARYYRSLCPGEWVDKWNEERDNGNYAGRY